MLYTLEQKPVEVDKVFNDSAATELDNTPVEESIDSNNVPHTDSNVQSDAKTYSEHASEQSINTGSGTHQTDMFDDTVPENSYHRSSVNESNNDEIEREIAIQSPNQITQGSDSSFIPRRSVRVKSKPQWMKNDQYVFSQIHQPDWKSRAEYLHSLMSTAAFKDVDSRVISDALINIITKSSD